jgi:AcrR family transcriptional regulator
VPRAGLSHDVVVREAATAADEVGLERLTLAVVAARLGVKVPSLYKHVDGLDDVRRALTLVGLADLTAALSSAAVGRAGRDALHGVADAYRDYAHRRPGCYAATVRAAPADDPEVLAAADALLRVVSAVLSGYGLTGDEAIDAIRALRSAMHGFVAIEAAGGFGLPHDVDRSYRRLVDGLDTTLSAWSRGQSGGDAVEAEHVQG